MITCVIGTRPEAIKMAPVIRALRRRDLPTRVVGTGQHSDWTMLGRFLDVELDERLPPGNGELLGSFVDIVSGLGRLFAEKRPRLVLAQGDTTSVVAAAFAARKSGCAFGHVEAGLRAFSRELPEEEHRICADALADLLFAPTEIAQANLARERVNGRVVLTGNPILDVLSWQAPPAATPRGLLVTLHRQELVDDPARLGPVVRALEELARHHRVEWPLHPRTEARLQRRPEGVVCLPPLGHGELLLRLAGAELVITDSGGVQEEAAILGTPSVVVRTSTERPETLAAGLGLLSGLERAGILDAVARILSAREDFARPTPQLYGDGHAGERIAEACAAFLGVQAAPRRAVS